MRSTILQCAAAITLFVALAVPARLVAQSNYSVVELGERGGTAGSANGINDRGWIRHRQPGGRLDHGRYSLGEWTDHPSWHIKRWTEQRRGLAS
jgi:hypothetical protein